MFSTGFSSGERDGSRMMVRFLGTLVEQLMETLKLPVNKQKTRCLRCPEEPLEFLGYRIGRNYRRNGQGAYIGTRPSKASVQSVCHKISELTRPRDGHQARAGGHGAEPDLVLGHHQAVGADQVDVLLPLRRARYLQPLRGSAGWSQTGENSALAGRLIEETCHKQGVQPQVLTLHSDRGAPMTSKCTAQLLADLGVTRSLSRPQVSDDNPFPKPSGSTHL